MEIDSSLKENATTDLSDEILTELYKMQNSLNKIESTLSNISTNIANTEKALKDFKTELKDFKTELKDFRSDFKVDSNNLLSNIKNFKLDNSVLKQH